MQAPLTYGWIDKAAKRMTQALLAHLGEGQLIVKEQGKLVGHYGDKSSDLSAEINVLDAKFYVRLLTGGSIGAAELFIDKAWETPN
ncbi:MAG: SAM-dependent methyltransferase, partial [Pseudomonadota bacterium]|nr:SAM-dependent methyltransferase [Pseudomonadota bacterium]